MSTRHRRRLAVVAVAAVIADALTKLAALRWLTDPIELAGLTLRVTRNPGVAFSLGASQPASVVLTVTGLAAAGFTIAAWRGHLGGHLPAGLLVGGALANLGDRAFGGSVIDLFDLSWWPVFNLADVFISAGIALLLVDAFVPSSVRDAPGGVDDHEPPNDDRGLVGRDGYR